MERSSDPLLGRMLGPESLERALGALGQVLKQRGLEYDLVAVGGSGLMLLGLIERPTRDLDVIAIVDAGVYRKAEPLPATLADAIRDIGEVLDIGTEWLNAGPTDLLDFGLPAGFADRTVTKHYGPLSLRLASRLDQVFFKLYAAADGHPQGKHFQDLKALRPTRDELIAGARWAMTHDPSDGFRSMIVGPLFALGVDDAESIL
jgi:Nucleotidyltransferase of unknown function (DUF6036)